MSVPELGFGSIGSVLTCIEDKDVSEFTRHDLQDMNFQISQAESVEDALEKMQFNQYEVIIIEDGFGGPLENNKILSVIKGMAPVQRRKVFVALLGDGWKTGDEMLAFTLSVNLLINRENLGQLKEILMRFMEQDQKFYKLFNDCRAALGKA